MAHAALVWVRNDLRVADNPALAAALSYGGPVTAIHIEPTDQGLRQRGAASRWWLHLSLRSLAAGLAKLGIPLETVSGDTRTEITAALERHDADALFWNRRYGAAERALDSEIKASLRANGQIAESSVGDVLVEPFEMETGAGKPYSVYTPFWKALRDRPIAVPLPAPKPAAAPIEPPTVDSGYRAPHWAAKLAQHWAIGEAAARDKLVHFLDELVTDYPEGRDVPSKAVTSRLSPHLAFGEISPRQIWHAAQQAAQAHPERQSAIDKFLSELAWRDFNHNQLYHRDDIATVPMQPKYAAMPWRDDPEALDAWQAGLTGFPIVDAGMRELWATGYMHNRVRMLVGSLLAKNLLIDWRVGERWFWDTLLDADPANNPGNWQWVAGCGLDASPYFRIFNPVTQGERFDPDGAYVRRWVPELAALPDEWIQKPWEAPPDVLRRAGVRLGETYPKPICDLKATRERALAALKEL